MNMSVKLRGNQGPWLGINLSKASGGGLRINRGVPHTMMTHFMAISKLFYLYKYNISEHMKEAI